MFETGCRHILWPFFHAQINPQGQNEETLQRFFKQVVLKFDAFKPVN